MNFKIDNDALIKALAVITKVVPSKTSVPAIASVLFTRKDNSLILTTTDLDIFCSVSLSPVSIDGNSPMLLPYDILKDAAGVIGVQPVNFTENEKNVGISWETGHMSLPLFDVADFPQFPETPQENILNMPASVIFTAVQRTAFATADDELRPIMNGIRFDIQNDQVTLVGTDSRKLILYDMTVSSPVPFGFTMSNKMATLTQAILGDKELDTEQRIEIRMGEKRYGYTVGNYTVTSSAVDGKFPRYRDVIPHNNNSILTVKRTDFVGILQRMGVFAKSKASNASGTGVVKLELNEITGVEISAQDLALNISAKESLDEAIYHGEDITIGFNVEQLLSVLKHRNAKSVNLKMDGGRRAVIIEDVPEEGNETEPITSIVMPCMVA